MCSEGDEMDARAGRGRERTIAPLIAKSRRRIFFAGTIPLYIFEVHGFPSDGGWGGSASVV